MRYDHYVDIRRQKVNVSYVFLEAYVKATARLSYISSAACVACPINIRPLIMYLSSDFWLIASR